MRVDSVSPVAESVSMARLDCGAREQRGEPLAGFDLLPGGGGFFEPEVLDEAQQEDGGGGQAVEVGAGRIEMKDEVFAGACGRGLGGGQEFTQADERGFPGPDERGVAGFGGQEIGGLHGQAVPGEPVVERVAGGNDRFGEPCGVGFAVEADEDGVAERGEDAVGRTGQREIGRGGGRGQLQRGHGAGQARGQPVHATREACCAG